jgi:hypothetical protein
MLRVLNRSFAGFAESIPTGDLYVCLFWLLCVVSLRLLLQAIHFSRRLLLSVLPPNVNVKTLNEKALAH